MDSVDTELFTLSPQQKRAWQAGQHGSAPRVQVACWAPADLEAAQLQECLQWVINANEIFRATLVTMPGLAYPLLSVSEETGKQTPVTTGSGFVGTTVEQALAWESAQTAHGTEETPLSLRLTPIRLDLAGVAEPARTLILLSAPALIADVRTLRLVVAELERHYTFSSEEFTEAPIPYSEYAQWREEINAEGSEQLAQGKAFWARLSVNESSSFRFADQKNASSLPGEASEAAGTVYLSPDTTAALKSLGAKHSADLMTVLLACWSLFVFRHSLAEPLRLGCVLDGRQYDEFAGSMGPYAQPVGLVFGSLAGCSLTEALAAVQTAVEEASLWQAFYVPSADRSGDRTLGSFGFEYLEPVETSGRAWTPCGQSTNAHQYKCKLQCYAVQDRIAGILSGLPSQFDRDELEELAERFVAFTAELIKSPQAQVEQISAFLDGEAARLEAQSVPAPKARDRNPSLAELFAAQANLTPDMPAVICQSTTLTFAELDRRSSQLAQLLVERGVGLGVAVCLLGGRDVDLITSILAIWKLGAVYVPMEAAYPAPERIAHIVEATSARVVLTQKRFQHLIPESGAAIVLLDDPATFSGPASSGFPFPVAPDDVAYILYTSGSTGIPKGVMVTQHSLVHLWHLLRNDIYGQSHLREGALRITVNAPLSFDSSIKQLVMLFSGYELHILEEPVRLDAQCFVQYVRDHKIDGIDCTPLHMTALLESGLADEGTHAPTLALIGGEAVSPGLWNRLAALPSTACWNVYGPTECTVDSTAARIEPHTWPNIGRALSGIRTYVLDVQGSPVSDGIPGELCIGGTGVALGYLDAPAQTAERFIPDRFTIEPGLRLYRTGDLVRRRRDGALEYMGRLDSQVKMRGFRIELEEISAALRTHRAVADAVVQSYQAADDTKLAAFYVPNAGVIFTVSDLQAHLERKLPEYMVPSSISAIAAIPRTPNGKLDRKALPDVSVRSQAAEVTYIGPSTPTESSLVALWSSLLQCERVGTRDSFFTLGGHSLLAMRMIARVRQEFSVNISLPQLFREPTIESLGRILDEHRSA